MINRMSILATSAVTLKQDIKLQREKQLRKVTPVERKFNGDLLRENPYANQVFTYDKYGKKVIEEETHFDKKI